MIKLKNVAKYYRVGNYENKALDNINISFREKEFICVHGPSGCGKTTLLNIIGGLDRSSEGQLTIKGTDTSKFKDTDWDAYRNKSIGFVFQNYYLLPHLTVYENVEIALNLAGVDKNERKRKVLAALEKVDLMAQLKNLPNQLSGGQMQRVAIARAIVNDTDIVLADEPTGALDSETAEKIMKILKEISHDRLVVVVSHNTELAYKYADRIIELFDGRIIGDSAPVTEDKFIKQYHKTKTAMSLVAAIKISLKNMLRTKLRTVLTSFAGCIGIIGVGLVLAISNGVNVYIEDVQKSALANYPIYIRSNAKNKEDENGQDIHKWERFPEETIINIRKGYHKNDYYNVIESDFLSYIEQLDKSLYTVVNYNTKVAMKIVAQTNDGYRMVSNSIFYELVEDDFVAEQYDVLAGTLPQSANQIALLVDEYNAMDAFILYYLGFDYESKNFYTFDEILGTKFKLLSNDEYYLKINDRYQAKTISFYPELFENAVSTLEITAIMRVKPDATTKLYNTGILYTPALTAMVTADAANSQIVKEQLEYGLDKNVFTGMPYEEKETMASTDSPEYQLKENLISLGAIVETTVIYIYTSSFQNRLQIASYVDNFKNISEEVEISYSDFIQSVTTEFASMVRVFSSVLIIFSSVSLIVSAILIGIITYVSVIERIREIGLLRSIGARKIDIARLFITEAAIIGFFSGLMGVVGARLFVNPINEFVVRMIKDYTVLFPGISQVIVAKFELKYLLVLIFGSMLLTVFAGLIPAIAASRKLPIKALRTEG
ncbi:MAG: ATP-binding cassette domain-containing protein [Bacilli bacterium]|nr:ATP-binding cassette domain-containing protein [Bacilli bacterium]